MTLTRVQALALALGLIMVGVAAAWSFPSEGPDAAPAQLDQSALQRGDLQIDEPDEPIRQGRTFDPGTIRKL
jgi:hypothetical protein